MKRFITVVGLIWLAICSPAFGRDDLPPELSAYLQVDTANSTNSTVPSNSTISVRCRAQEVSQGQAIWILLILAISSVVQRPGSSILQGHTGFHRSVPEFAIFETSVLLSQLIWSIFYYKKSFILSVKSVFALRYFFGKGESWWLAARTHSSAEATDQTRLLPQPEQDEHDEDLREFLDELENYNHSRLIGLLLTCAAFVKACVIKGSVRTTFLAICFFLPYSVIEILSWLCLRLRPPLSSEEQCIETSSCVDLMAALDPFPGRAEAERNLANDSFGHTQHLANRHRTGAAIRFSVSSNQNQKLPLPLELVSSAMLYLSWALCVVLIFWPVSVPLFLFWDFTDVPKGHWVFVYLTSFLWALCLAGVGLVTTLSLCLWAKFRKVPSDEMGSYLIQTFVPKSWRWDTFAVGAYVLLKWVLTFRMYLISFSGQNTRKPEWLDWLG